MYIFKLDLFWLTIAPTYYWLMYVLWFIFGYFIVKNELNLKTKKIDSLLLYIFLWVVLWWRIWYILFYDLAYYIENPINIIKTWQWWMSFHGWVIWVIIAMFLFSKKHKFSFLKLSDAICYSLPFWLFFWRIWNYINKELLWFSPYSWPLAIYKNWEYFFPSALLEAVLEWIVLFFILRYFKNNKKLKKWQIAALFLIFYASFRIFVEAFFRLPDSHIWYIFWFLTMWEILSFPMLLVWLYYYIKLWKK